MAFISLQFNKTVVIKPFWRKTNVKSPKGNTAGFDYNKTKVPVLGYNRI